jgi:non-haem dioxygenase in morphine synthesis N-terminal
MTIEQPVYGEKNMQQIPVIDLSAARSGGLASRQAVARQIDATCREIGFFTITGHGVPIATMDQLRSKAHAFFALPLEEKRSAIHPVPGMPRGYRAQGLEALAQASAGTTRPTSRSSIISAGKAGQTSGTIPRPKAGIISYRICGRSSRRALPMRLKLTMRKWRSWPR